MDSVEEIGLFVVVGGEDDVEDDSLENLAGRQYGSGEIMSKESLHSSTLLGPQLRLVCRTLPCNACKHPNTYHPALPAGSAGRRTSTLDPTPRHC